MSLKGWLQSSDSSESSETLQGFSWSASCSARTTSAGSRPMRKRNSADANDLKVDDPNQVRLRAYPVCMVGAKKRCLNSAWYQR